LSTSQGARKPRCSEKRKSGYSFPKRGHTRSTGRAEQRKRERREDGPSTGKKSGLLTQGVNPFLGGGRGEDVKGCLSLPEGARAEARNQGRPLDLACGSQRRVDHLYGEGKRIRLVKEFYLLLREPDKKSAYVIRKEGYERHVRRGTFPLRKVFLFSFAERCEKRRTKKGKDVGLIIGGGEDLLGRTVSFFRGRLAPEGKNALQSSGERCFSYR